MHHDAHRRAPPRALTRGSLGASVASASAAARDASQWQPRHLAEKPTQAGSASGQELVEKGARRSQHHDRPSVPGPGPFALFSSSQPEILPFCFILLCFP